MHTNNLKNQAKALRFAKKKLSLLHRLKENLDLEIR